MNDNQRVGAMFTLLLAVASAFLGWVTIKDSLAPQKPPGDRVSAMVPYAEQDIMARLWEDPLQAVEAAIKTEPAAVNDPLHHISALEHTIATLQAGGLAVRVLGVSIPGTPYPASAETRLRMRYALQMAMAASGFAPDNYNYLGYARVAWPRRGQLPEELVTLADEGTRTSLTLPYEFFRQRAAPGVPSTNRVLVLWLPDEPFADGPLCRLGHLLKELTPAGAEDRMPFALIGPSSSNPLGEIASAGAAKGHALPDRCVLASGLADRLTIHSPRATAADPFLGLTNASVEARIGIQSHLEHVLGTVTNQIFFNGIRPDNELTDLLVRELQERGVRVGVQRGRTNVALLLAAADTSYGRALPITVQASILSGGQSNRTLEAIEKLLHHPEAGPPAVKIVRYLDGLDKEKGFNASDSARRSGKPTTAPEEMLAQALTRQSEPAQGESQLDYAERLAQNLEDDSRRNGTRVQAIGIFGGDVYDKVILLRAVRKVFPEAVFFTTDLDARLWHPDNLPFTRNLVVATACGLKPERQPSGQQLPPFRDVYQACVFRAVCQALDSMIAHAAPDDTRLPAAELYEIGRNGPVRLDPPGWGRERITKSFQHVAMSAPFFVVAGLLVGMTFRRPGTVPGEVLFGARLAYAGWFLLGTFAAVGVVAWAAMQWGEEPWSWSGGISAWPTQLVRVLTLGLAAWALALGWRLHQMSRTRMVHYYFSGCPRPAEPMPVLRAAFARWPEKAGGLIDAWAIFQTYQQRSRGGARAVRVTLYTLAYLVAGGMFMQALGGAPERPFIRGAFDRGFDAAMLALVVIGSTGLTFYVLDSVATNARMLLALGSANSVWPRSVLRKAREQHPVPAADLDGWLDVEFTAEKTVDTSRLLWLPFLVQFLLLISRNKFFDNWSWPPSLVVIFSCNVFFALIAWFVLRRAARMVREGARGNLQHRLGRIEAYLAMKGSAALPKARARAFHLGKLLQAMDREHRGAYASPIQDPGVIAVLIPTGLLGIVTLLMRALFGGM